MLECIPDILEPAAVRRIREAIKEQAFRDGAETAGYRARRVKKNEQLGRDAPDREALDKLVTDGLKANKTFQRVAHPHRIRRPLFSRYTEGKEYGLHVDDAVMGGTFRTDLSVTVFLNQPMDYEGGELELLTGYGPTAVKLPAGAAVVYPSGALHRVRPVTRGERLAAVTWVQSRVRDVAQREILADLDRARHHFAGLEPEGEETDLLFKSYSNLLRIWAEV